MWAEFEVGDKVKNSDGVLSEIKYLANQPDGRMMAVLRQSTRAEWLPGHDLWAPSFPDGYTKVEPFFEVGETYVARDGGNTFECLYVGEDFGGRIAFGKHTRPGEDPYHRKLSIFSNWMPLSF